MCMGRYSGIFVQTGVIAAKLKSQKLFIFLVSQANRSEGKRYISNHSLNALFPGMFRSLDRMCQIESSVRSEVGMIDP